MVENMKTTKTRDGGVRKDGSVYMSRFADFEYPEIKKEKVVSFQTVEKKAPVTIPLDENKSFSEILSRFEGKKLNLRMIMDWSVTNKPYAVAADGRVRSNSKTVFRNYLQCLCQVKSSSDPSTAFQTSIVDAMRVVRMISIKNTNPTIFLSWAKNIFSYIHGLPGDNLQVTFLIITAFLRIQQKFYLREELIDDRKGKVLV